MIDKILTKAICFWLRTQAEAVEELELTISGGDRKLLSGNIPRVSFSCSRAAYQGVYLRHIEIAASNIGINIGGVIKGKPLKLLEPVPIEGNLVINGEDLQNSVTSPLLKGAFNDFLAAIWEASDRPLETCPDRYAIDWQEIRLQRDKFVLKGSIETKTGQIHPIILQSGLELCDSHSLNLSPLQVEAAPICENLSLSEFSVDLGELVEIAELSLSEGCLTCRGKLIVMP